MRLAFVGLLTVAAALTAFVRPGDAQHNSRFCAISVGDEGSGMPDCSFRTMEQCRATTKGLGYCTENPSYTEPRQGSTTQGRTRRQRDG